MADAKEYAYVRRQTTIKSGVGKSELAFTGKYEIVSSKSGWGGLGEVIGVVDDKPTALSMCKLINGSAYDRQEEVVSWNGYKVETGIKTDIKLEWI